MNLFDLLDPSISGQTRALLQQLLLANLCYIAGHGICLVALVRWWSLPSLDSELRSMRLLFTGFFILAALHMALLFHDKIWY